MVDDPEAWGRRQRRKGGWRVVGAGVAVLAIAVFAWMASDGDFENVRAVKGRLVGFGAGILGLALLALGIFILVRADRPPPPHDLP
jgi:hypothetical protein